MWSLKVLKTWEAPEGSEHLISIRSELEWPGCERGRVRADSSSAARPPPLCAFVSFQDSLGDMSGCFSRRDAAKRIMGKKTISSASWTLLAAEQCDVISTSCRDASDLQGTTAGLKCPVSGGTGLLGGAVCSGSAGLEKNAAVGGEGAAPAGRAHDAWKQQMHGNLFFFFSFTEMSKHGRKRSASSSRVDCERREEPPGSEVT
ncbi:unnamed protein product [Pleuronectes platessa]|uniref:Uncharacterized protein n=1 Tax=Pleuronectes platessa TaxID=8262 RepID=A0A9N7UDV0_PLEPL|nr:unnamed protein product [Pleuronectes platessa]